MSGIEYLHSNWPHIKNKGIFVVFGALMFAAGFRANEYFNNKTERDLRDRIDIQKEVKGSLSTLPNEALKQKTLDLVAKMRELLASENEEQLAIRQRYENKTKHLGPDYSELDEPILQEAWSEMTAA